MSLVIPDITIYLVGVLGLLALWQYHQMQVMAGRIEAIDVFDRSGIRMYLYAIPNDEPVCDICARAHGRVFLPSQVAKRGFSPVDGQCSRTSACPGILIGFYGGWLEARSVVDRLRSARKHAGVQLTPEELRTMVSGQWERSISGETDRLGVHMLEALCYERINPDVAIDGYQYVIAQAKEVRHLLFVTPSYLRLIHLLLQVGRGEEALEVIEHCESRFSGTKRKSHFPSTEQRKLLKAKKAQLQRVSSVKSPSSLVTGSPVAIAPPDGQ